MATDLKLDKSTHDIELALGDFTLATEREEIAQSIGVRLLFLEAEWVINYTLGVPWFDIMFQPGPQLLKNQILRQVLADTQGVNEITSYAFEVDPVSKGAAVTFQVNTVYGETLGETVI